MDRTEFEALVAEARLAPSAHNTQPVRWRQSNAEIHLFADLSRRLLVGDPDDRDLKISCGAAVEGTVLALATAGVGATVSWVDAPDDGHLHPVARVIPVGKPRSEDTALAGYMHQRITHRSGFALPPDKV